MLEIKTREEVEVLEDEEVLTDSTYRVILFNDDVTPVQIVIIVLTSVFELGFAETIDKMLECENNGKAVAGKGYSFLTAQSKVEEANKICGQFGFELKFEIEEE